MSISDERSPIIVEDDALRDGFTQLPNAVLRHPGLTLGAKIAYGVLLSYAWTEDHCFPGQQRLARDMACAERSVRTYLQQLEDAEMITVQQRGMGKTNLYIIHRIRPANIADQDRQEMTLLDRPNLPAKNTQGKDSKKKTKTSNFEDSKAPTPMKRVQPVTPEFKSTHPDLWQAGCSGVAEFIRVVGRGLWADEAMNVSQWRAHNQAVKQAAKR